jgi:hypothetical protein
VLVSRFCFIVSLACGVLALGVMITAVPSQAATVTQGKVFQDAPAIRLSGPIIRGDYDQVRKLAKTIADKGSQVIISLNSEGGDFEEALRIADLVRQLNAQTHVSGVLTKESSTPFERCLSACFLIHAAGSIRHYGLDNMRFDATGNQILAEEPVIGIHRPFLNPQLNRSLSATQSRERYEAIEAATRKLMGQVSVPQDLVDVMFRTPSNEIHWIKSADFSKKISQYQPYYQEWIKSKCGSLDSKEINDLARVDAMRIARGNTSFQPADLSPGYVQYLSKKQLEVDRCSDTAVLEHQRAVLRTFK